MTPWTWWAGYSSDVEGDGTYCIGEFDTRAEAIAAGLNDTLRGETFHIIEARSSTDRRHEGADTIPFVRMRHHEIITNGPRS
ncbi:hypothetical protein DFR49_2303 [Hephaestia caeni]|uniref:Uncharacterized protein n=1 Tax=Hephaestia caeni TaxID=645617 RepID=A0A397PA63_9SPHN|nr:hypothetical protein [Hephaestia caeni]RIA44067.1 hypothetical protein DFR49_2303 [Hephaestia caeni]